MMAVWNPKTEGELGAIQTLVNESDRSAAIIAATFVEDRLEQGLTSRFRHDAGIARQVVKRIFQPTEPLGTFSAKIRLGFLLRIYGKQVFNELNTIRNIRNRFAHIIGESAVLSFQSPEIVLHCNKLKIVEHYHRPLSEFTMITDPAEATRRSGISFSDNPPPSDILDNPRRRYTETCGLLAARFDDPDHPRSEDLPADEFLILGDEPFPLP